MGKRSTAARPERRLRPRRGAQRGGPPVARAARPRRGPRRRPVSAGIALLLRDREHRGARGRRHGHRRRDDLRRRPLDRAPRDGRVHVARPLLGGARLPGAAGIQIIICARVAHRRRQLVGGDRPHRPDRARRMAVPEARARARPAPDARADPRDKFLRLWPRAPTTASSSVRPGWLRRRGPRGPAGHEDRRRREGPGGRTLPELRVHPGQGGAGSADILTEVREAGSFGITVGEPTVDYGAIMDRRGRSSRRSPAASPACSRRTASTCSRASAR